MITFDIIPEELKLQKGKHKGGLNQKLLQVKGSFEDGDPHPFDNAKGISFWRIAKGRPSPQVWLVDCQRVKALNPSTGKHWIIGEFNPENGKYFRQYTKNSRDGMCWIDKKERLEGYNEKAKEYRQSPIGKQKMKEWEENNPESLKLKAKKYNDKNREARNAWSRNYAKENKETRNEWRREYRKLKPEKVKEVNSRQIAKKQKERTISLNEFYLDNEIPKYLWHKEEFAKEKDLQKAIEHVIVKKYGLTIVHEMHTKQGRFDIFIKELNLIVEVKLLSTMWDAKKVDEQAKRYSKIAETLIVSLDGKPKGWLTPKKLFKAIKSRV
jgi:hypothetical protein